MKDPLVKKETSCEAASLPDGVGLTSPDVLPGITSWNVLISLQRSAFLIQAVLLGRRSRNWLHEVRLATEGDWPASADWLFSVSCAAASLPDEVGITSPDALPGITSSRQRASLLVKGSLASDISR